MDINQLVISDKFKHNDKGSKYFIGFIIFYLVDVIGPLCVVLLQMSGYIKYFGNGGKNMSFRIADDSVLIKYNEICNRIKGLLGTKFHSNLVFDENYIKAEVKTFNGTVHTIFWSNAIPKESIHYTWIAVLNIDFVKKMD